MVEFGNIYYCLYWIMAIGIFFVLFFVLKNKSRKTQYLVLFSLLLFNFALHFLKLFFEPYRSGLPGSFRKVSFENICAVSVLIMPWVFLYKKSKALNHYVFFIGVVGGVAAFIYPTEALGEAPFVFDTIRFYVCHYILFLVPFLSALLGMFQPEIKKFWLIPLVFIMVEYLILINEIVLIKLDLVNSDLAAFLDRDTRNNAFIFGPTSDMGGISKAFTIFTPPLFTKDIFNINNGVPFYWPVIWMVVPIFLYLPAIYIFISLPFNIKKKKEKITLCFSQK